MVELAHQRQAQFLGVSKENLYHYGMRRNLTHLNALHALEVSARRGSFARAAQELGVTPAAVGQQVRILEDFLGAKAFHRTANGLQPTNATLLALSELREGFDRLESGMNRLVGPAAGNQLSVSVAPTLAWKWLARRMQGLYERSPHIDLRMDTSLKIVDIEGGEFDIAIRYRKDESPGLENSFLFDDHILPVCSPNIWKASDEAPDEVRMFALPLLHIEGETTDAGIPSWRDWGRESAIEKDRLGIGPRYPQTAMAVQAAINDQGVALCGLTSVIDDLVAGRLITPLRPAAAVKPDHAYRIVYARKRYQSEIQKIFVRWIKAEAAKTREVMVRFLSGHDVTQ